MLDKLFNKVEENYAIKALRKLETMVFESREEAEKYYETMYDVLHHDLDCIDVIPNYEEKTFIITSGEDIGKRVKNWTVKLDMRRYIRV